MTQPAHVPVLLAEVLAALAPAPGERMVDGTFGAGGYSRAILASGASVTAFDRDPSVARFADGLPADRFRLVAAPFSAMAEELGEGSADGVALDLGVSSMQVDEAERGFSFMRDGPLDMRMGDEGRTAADIVNDTDPGDLARLFRAYGEEREARRIVGAIVRRRAEQPFTRTLELAEAVERAVGGRKGAKVHPATRVFQALRIAVNEELTELEAGLEAAEQVLAEGGRLAIVTFHSLEDRLVKNFLTVRGGRTPAGSRHAPPKISGPEPTFSIPKGGAVAPSDAEVEANPRARSAKLRVAHRTAAQPWRIAA